MSFSSKAPGVIARLVKDIPQWQVLDACACLGNLGAESGLAAVQEVGQTPPHGGFGWAQWTGPRRTDFFNFCTSHNLDPNSDEGNYQMLLSELKGPYASTVAAVAAAPDLTAKTAAFEQFYERAGVIRMQARDNMASAALAAWQAHPLNQLYAAPAPLSPVHPGVATAAAGGVIAIVGTVSAGWDWHVLVPYAIGLVVALIAVDIIWKKITAKPAPVPAPKPVVTPAKPVPVPPAVVK